MSRLSSSVTLLFLLFLSTTLTSCGSGGSNSTDPNNSPPELLISKPANGDNFAAGADVNLLAIVNDEDSDLGASVSWRSSRDGMLGNGLSLVTNLSAGSHNITADVMDSGGKTSSQSVSIAVVESIPDPSENIAPQLSLLMPANNDQFPSGAGIRLQATASDAEDGDISKSISWSSSIAGSLGQGADLTTTLADGSHVITARISDSGGLSDSEVASITIGSTGVQNSVPAVSISAPSGTSVPEGTPLILNASANDAEDGNISAGLQWTSSRDGDLSISGGSFNTILSAGTHTITASVADSGSAIGADSISVTIIASDIDAKAFYVDRNHPDASDSNPGTESRPWKTIVHAAETLTAGERAYIKAGIYNDGDVHVKHSGTQGREIVFSAYPGDERKAVIYAGTFYIRGQSHIKVLGLKIEKSSKYGFRIDGNVDPYGEPVRNITLSGNHTYDTYKSAISAWGVPYNSNYTDVSHFGDFDNINGLIIEYNLIEKANNGGYNENITLANGVVNAVVRHNELTTGGDPINGGEGIDFKDGVRDSKIHDNYLHGLSRRAIYVDGGEAIGAMTSNIHIYNNLIIDDPSSAIFVATEGPGSVDGIYIYNNLILGSEQNGISIYDHPQGEINAEVKNIMIFNNTVIDGGRGGSWGNIGVNHERAKNIVIRNNITLNGNSHDISVKSGSTATVENNLCRESFCEIQGDPQFVSPTFDKETADYRLRSGSSAIDAGVSSIPSGFDMGAPGFDANGVARPQGATIDLGAYEYR